MRAAKSARVALFVFVLAVTAFMGAPNVLDAVPHPDNFKPAEHRDPPQVPTHDASGNPCPPRNDCTSAKPPRIITIMPKGYPFESDLKEFSQAMIGGDWYAQVSAAYDLPAASAEVIIADDLPDLNSGEKTVNDYRNWLFKKGLEGVIKPSPNRQTVFLMYLPCDDNHKPRPGMDSEGCTSHHFSIDPCSNSDPCAGQNNHNKDFFALGDAMALVLAFNPKDSSAPQLESLTVPATHESVESMTDSRSLLTFKLATSDTDHPYRDSGSNDGGRPWVRESGSTELGDMSEGARISVARSGGKGSFVLERIYSNRAVRKHGDPAVPPSTFPYFNVSTDDWFVVAPGKIAEIPVTAWAESKDVGEWNVDVSVPRWFGHRNTPPTAVPCSLDKTHFTAKNDEHFTVRVQTSAVRVDSWCILRLKSTKNVTNGDDYHEWWVGVHIVPPVTPQDEACVCSDGFKAGPAARAGTEACEHICRAHERH